MKMKKTGPKSTILASSRGRAATLSITAAFYMHVVLVVAAMSSVIQVVTAAFTSTTAFVHPARTTPFVSHRKNTRSVPPVQSTVAALFDSNKSSQRHHLLNGHRRHRGLDVFSLHSNAQKEEAFKEEEDSSNTVENRERALTSTESSTNPPRPVLMSWLQKLTKLERPTATSSMASVLALALVLWLTPMSAASAAMSGGRMGGSFSSSSSSYSRSGVITRSMPSTARRTNRSYYRSRRRRGGSSYSRGYASGFARGYLSRPRPYTIHNPFDDYGGPISVTTDADFDLEEVILLVFVYSVLLVILDDYL